MVEPPVRVPLSRYFDDSGEEEVARVYLAVLEDPAPNREKIIGFGIEPEVVDRAVGVLHWRGLMDASDPDRWTVAAPDIALRAYASAIERQARRARSMADDMAQVYQQTRASEPRETGQQVRVLTSVADLDNAIGQVLARARSSVLVMRAVPSDTHQIVPLINLRRTVTASGPDQGIPVRALYDSAMLDLPDVLEALRRRSAEGEQVRLAPHLSFSAIIVDASRAVLDFRNVDPSGQGSYLVRSGPIVAALTSVVERLYAGAVPLPPPGKGIAEQPGLTERDQLILTLLAAGASDSTITRQVGVSRRTVERRVRHLLTHLGANTRFQGGVEASRRGLV